MDAIMGLLPQVITLKLFWIILGAFIGGVGVTQYAKQWLDPHWPRFKVTVQSIAILSTALFTVLAWRYAYPFDSHHLEKVVGLIVGFASPPVYHGVKALIALRFKAMARRMSCTP